MFLCAYTLDEGDSVLVVIYLPFSSGEEAGFGAPKNQNQITRFARNQNQITRFARNQNQITHFPRNQNQ